MTNNIDRLLNSVGTNTFVTYFSEFQTLEKDELIQLFEKNNEPWSENSRVQKAHDGKRIVNESRAREALEYIVAHKKENNIPNGAWVKNQASLLLENM